MTAAARSAEQRRLRRARALVESYQQMLKALETGAYLPPDLTPQSLAKDALDLACLDTEVETRRMIEVAP